MTRISRRRLIRSTGTMAAFASLRPDAAQGASRQPQASASPPPADATARLVRYMVAARDLELPAAIATAAKARLLDTLGAIVSGARLKPGEMAIRYIRTQGGTPEATVLTAGLK